MEFNLSEKIHRNVLASADVIYKEDVQEFIKILRSKRNNGDFVHMRDIEKYAGERFK